MIECSIERSRASMLEWGSSFNSTNRLRMTFDSYVTAMESWFQKDYGYRNVGLIIEQLANGEARVLLTGASNVDSGLCDPAPFNVAYAAGDGLENTQLVIANKMLSRDERRRELMAADINDPESGGLIDGFYTDCSVVEGDRIYLERLFQSSDLETRREALIALTFGVNKDTGPQFTGYAMEALVLHLLGVIEDTDSQYTGVDVLAVLQSRGDLQAATILASLTGNDKWRRTFFT
jgi:hypothetical protein